MSISPALDTRALTVRYGGVLALDSVSVSIAPGELVGLIGPNGAGKTTFIDAVTGFCAAEGSVLVDGVDVSGRRPDVRARRGLARTWQAADLFDDLTVTDNLVVAAGRVPPGQALRELVTGRRTPVEYTRLLERLGVGDLAETSPTELSQGQRKLVGVARALVAAPRVLLLDEPAAGLDAHESAAFGERLRAVVCDGLSALLVDHDMNLVMSVCDRIVVLEFGRLIADGTPEEIRSDPRVIAAYLGDASDAGVVRA